MTSPRIRRFFAFALACALAMAACGTPEEFETFNPLPASEELLASLHSPTEVSTLTSFRVRSSMEMTGLPDLGDGVSGGRGSLAMLASVTLDPPALRLDISEPEGKQGEQAQSSQMVMVGDPQWINDGDGWTERKAFISGMTDWFIEAFSGAQTTMIDNKPETDEFLERAENIGVEDVSGCRTTHFQMSTAQVVELMMAGYERLADEGPLTACEGIEDRWADASDLEDVAEEDITAFMECLASAFAAKLPPPREYIERYEIDIWVADQGFVMREHSEAVFSPVRLSSFLEGNGDHVALPVTMTSSYEMYDLNAPFTIEPPTDG
jgi:hypothetical protein